MHLAQTYPLAGHLGCRKTHMWDMQKCCSTCPTCQRTSINQRSDRAFMQPLPITSTPFCRIGAFWAHWWRVDMFTSAFWLHVTILCVSPKLFFSSPLLLQLMQLFKSQQLRPRSTIHRLVESLHKIIRLWKGCCKGFEMTSKKNGTFGYHFCFLHIETDLPRNSCEGPSDSQSDRSMVRYVLKMRNRLAEYQEEAEVNLWEASKKPWYEKDMVWPEHTAPWVFTWSEKAASSLFLNQQAPSDIARPVSG